MNESIELQLSDRSKKTIPNGWMWTTIGEISNNIQYGYTATAIDGRIGPKFLRITDIQDNMVNWNTVPYCKIDSLDIQKYLLRTGDLLFARTGATVGKSYLIYKDVPYSVFASYLIRIALSDFINKKYIAYFFQSTFYWNQIMKKRIGTGQPNVNGNILSKLLVPIPPIYEQHRIVSKLEKLFTKLDAGIDALKKTKIQLKNYRQSILKYAFEGKLTESWRNSHRNEIELDSIDSGEHKKNLKNKLEVQPLLDSKNVTSLTRGWIYTKLSYVCDLISGQHIMECDYNRNNIGMPYITGPADFSNIYPIISKWTEKPKVNAIKNDVLITVKGAGVGKVNILDIHKAAISRQVMAIRTNLSVYFIYYYLCYNFRMLQRLGAGSTVPGIDRRSILDIILPLPSLLEQNKIVDEIEHYFSVIDNDQKIIGQSLKQSERLRQSVLKTTFEGKLTSQDSTDEPAGILLQRIKTEKSKQQTLGKANKKTNKIDNNQMRLV